MARYLMAASPLAGHVMPMLGIAADLHRRGHDVTLVTGPPYLRAIERRGVRAVALPQAAQPQATTRRQATVKTPLLIDLWRSGRADMRSVFVDPLLAQYRTLQAELVREHTDAVVVDVAFTGALPLILSGPGRPPVAVCGVSPLTVSSVDTPPFGIGWHPRRGVDYAAMNWFVHHVLFADVQARLNAALREAGTRRSPVFLTDWPTLADRVLQLTVAGAEYPRGDLSSSVVYTGPVIAPPVVDGAELPPWWPQLTAGRTVVLVTQGTWDNRDLGQLIRPTLAALAERDDLLVVATTGVPDQAACGDAVPANARVAGYLPYGALLPHVDVMITNGGYGAVQHALRHGIPLIVAGRTADKTEVAARVDFIGAGIDLKTDRPTTTAIAEAVQRIMTTERYRDAAQRVRVEMLAASPLDTIAEELARLHAGDAQPHLAAGTS